MLREHHYKHLLCSMARTPLWHPGILSLSPPLSIHPYSLSSVNHSTLDGVRVCAYSTWGIKVHVHEYVLSQGYTLDIPLGVVFIVL